MNQYLASMLVGATCGLAVEIVAAAFQVKSPNWRSWRWWVAWCAVMASGAICFLLRGAIR